MILVEEIEHIQRFGKEKNEVNTPDKAFNILVLQC